MVTLKTAPDLDYIAVGEDAICYNPGISTQIDGLTHIGWKDTFMNGTRTKDEVFVTGEKFDNKHHNFHAPKDVNMTGIDPGFQPPIMGPIGVDVNITYLKDLGIDTVPPMVSRAIILDMLAYKGGNEPALVYTDNKGKRMLKAGVPVSGDDIEAVLALYGLEVVEGDAVFIYTGWQHLQLDDGAMFMKGEPGFDMSAARYLAAKGVWTVGSDSWGTENILPTDQGMLDMLPRTVPRTVIPHILPDGDRSPWPVHSFLLFENSIFNLENLDLAAAAEDGVRECLFTLGAPKSPTPQAHINPVCIGVPAKDGAATTNASGYVTKRPGQGTGGGSTATIDTNSCCAKYGEFEGASDAAVWRHGVAFMGSGTGSCVGDAGPGSMLVVLLDETMVPEVKAMELKGLPEELGFQPHGIYIDRKRQRVYVLSHSRAMEEEHIVVFKIMKQFKGNRESRVPVLEYLHTLISPDQLPWQPAEVRWFLNDIVAVDGQNELLATQFGPDEYAAGLPYPNDRARTHLFKCTWTEGKGSNMTDYGRLYADCGMAEKSPVAHVALSGLAINGDGSRIWVNDAYDNQLLVFHRDVTDGSLTPQNSIILASTKLDSAGKVSADGYIRVGNVEYDQVAGELTMGVADVNGQSVGLGEYAVEHADSLKSYGNLFRDFSCGAVLPDGIAAHYSVSSGLVYGDWAVVGGYMANGLAICDQATKRRTSGPRCKVYREEFTDSADVSLWSAKDDIVFATSGLFLKSEIIELGWINGTDPRLSRADVPAETIGKMLAVKLPSDRSKGGPVVEEMVIKGLPSGLGFQPHAMSIDRKAQRLYVLSHSRKMQEEQIFVFMIDDSESTWYPSLQFQYYLVAPDKFVYPLEGKANAYLNVSYVFFLNDVGAIEGANELYATQFGPYGGPSADFMRRNDHHVWRCTWNDGMTDYGRLTNSRVTMDCAHASDDTSMGFNGMTVNPEGTRLWANDIHVRQLRVYNRDTTTGALARLNSIALPSMVDNVEYDTITGNLMLGASNGQGSYLNSDPTAETAGVLVFKNDDASIYKRASVVRRTVAPAVNGVDYTTSAAVTTAGWVVLGSSCGTGPVICSATPLGVGESCGSGLRSSKKDDDNDGLGAGAIVAIVIVVLMVLLCIGAIVYTKGECLPCMSTGRTASTYKPHGNHTPSEFQNPLATAEDNSNYSSEA